MSGRDWHALARKLGPQQAAYHTAPLSREPAVHCARCGKRLTPPGIVITRTAVLCPVCVRAADDMDPATKDQP